MKITNRSHYKPCRRLKLEWRGRHSAARDIGERKPVQLSDEDVARLMEQIRRRREADISRY